jgi:putative hydrolase of the HAD superfamily
VKAVLFDLGGTLVEGTSPHLNVEKSYFEDQIRAIHDSLRNDGIDVSWVLFREGYDRERTCQNALSERTLREHDMYERISNTLKALGFEVPSGSRILHRALDAYVEEYIRTLRVHRAAHNVLTSLVPSHKLGLVSNFAYPPCAYRVLGMFNLRPFFKAIAVSGEVGWRKPSPVIFEYALTKLDVEAHDAVFVGDDYEADILGATNVGMKTIMVSTEDDTHCIADAKIRSLEELLAVEWLV